MTQEDKELLLQDLCARLPYEVRMFEIEPINDIQLHLTLYSITNKKSVICITPSGGIVGSSIDAFKPYLFPISSMTEEQKKEYYSLADDVTIKPGQGCYLGIKIHCIKLGISDNPHEEVWDYINLDALNWLNKNHFDYRGLIEKDLAIDASGLNIY